MGYPLAIIVTIGFMVGVWWLFGIVHDATKRWDDEIKK